MQLSYSCIKAVKASFYKEITMRILIKTIKANLFSLLGKISFVIITNDDTFFMSRCLNLKLNIISAKKKEKDV